MLIKSNEIDIPSDLINKKIYNDFIENIKQIYIWRDVEEKELIKQLIKKRLDSIIVCRENNNRNSQLQVLTVEEENKNSLSRYWHTKFYNFIPVKNRTRFDKLSHGIAELCSQRKLKPEGKYKLSWYEDALYLAVFI